MILTRDYLRDFQENHLDEFLKTSIYWSYYLNFSEVITKPQTSPKTAIHVRETMLVHELILPLDPSSLMTHQNISLDRKSVV